MGLPVDKVAPAANALADEQPQAPNVQHGGGADFLDLGENNHRRDCADNAAVDGQATLPDVQHPDGVVPV